MYLGFRSLWERSTFVDGKIFGLLFTVVVYYVVVVVANTFQQFCASKQRTKAEERKKAVRKKKKKKKKNEVCRGGCFGARDDERVGVVVETS